MNSNEKLDAIYKICEETKEGGFIEESTIDEIISIIVSEKNPQ